MYGRAFLNSIVVATLSTCALAVGEGNHYPNILIIYADDMGYGDLACQNPDAKLTTPNLDQLAREGMRFTDGHSSSGICTALLTGQYHWRRMHGIVEAMGASVFEQQDLTLPSMLKRQGYHTGSIGKWHLGWDWDALVKPGAKKISYDHYGQKRERYPATAYEWSKSIPEGPCAQGFDTYFGDGTINMPPYCWIENDHVVEPPLEEMELGRRKTKEGDWEFRAGPMVRDWNPYDVLPTLTRKGVEWIEDQSAEKPFFLYFAFPSPHAPIIPNDGFLGKTNAGAYGDFVYQTDWVTGQLLQALEQKGFADNTLVIFTSDNGPERYAYPRMEEHDHYSAGDLRGLKRDVWEGGHRVPFIVRWPGHIPADTVSDEVISQVDLMATIATITEYDLPEDAAVDSYNLLPVLQGLDYPKPLREATVQNTYEKAFALRKGRWLFIDAPSGEHSKSPQFYNKQRGYQPNDTPGLLFDLKEDLSQKYNLYDQYPEVIRELQALLAHYKAGKRTAP